MDASTYAAIILLIGFVFLAVYLNYQVRMDIKDGYITKEDIEEANEDHRIW